MSGSVAEPDKVGIVVSSVAMPRKALSGRSRSHGGSASSPDGGRFGGGSPYRRAAHRGRRGGGVVHKAAQSTGLALDPGDRTDPRIVGSHRSDRLRQRRGRLQVRGGRSGSDRHGRADSTHGGDCRHAGGQTGSRHDALFSGSGLTGQASWDARSRGPRCLKRSMSQTTLPVTDLNDRVPAERSLALVSARITCTSWKAAPLWPRLPLPRRQRQSRHGVSDLAFDSERSRTARPRGRSRTVQRGSGPAGKPRPRARWVTLTAAGLP